MRFRNLVLSAPVLAAGLFSIGCGNTSPPGGGAGGTGATTRTTTTSGGTTVTTAHSTSDADKAAGTFKLKGPLLSPSVEQGKKEVVNLSVDKDNNFKQAVKLDIVAPKGLKVDASSKSVAAGDKGEVQLTIEADKDAPLGEHTVKITGTPDTGSATTLDMKVKVNAAK